MVGGVDCVSCSAHRTLGGICPWGVLLHVLRAWFLASEVVYVCLNACQGQIGGVVVALDVPCGKSICSFGFLVDCVVGYGCCGWV